MKKIHAKGLKSGVHLWSLSLLSLESPFFRATLYMLPSSYCMLLHFFLHISYTKHAYTHCFYLVDPALNSKVYSLRGFLEVLERFSHIYDHFFLKILVQNQNFRNISRINCKYLQKEAIYTSLTQSQIQTYL